LDMPNLSFSRDRRRSLENGKARRERRAFRDLWGLSIAREHDLRQGALFEDSEGRPDGKAGQNDQEKTQAPKQTHRSLLTGPGVLRPPARARAPSDAPQASERGKTNLDKS
jgi:hypothetical protein